MGTILVNIRHARILKYCTKGIRSWCQLRGIDFDKLSGEGVPVEEIESTNDHMAMEVARIARADVKEGE